MRTQQAQSKANIPHIAHAQYTHHTTAYDLGWLYELLELIEKYSYLGINPDLAGMSLQTARGVHAHLVNHDQKMRG